MQFHDDNFWFQLEFGILALTKEGDIGTTSTKVTESDLSDNEIDSGIDFILEVFCLLQRIEL